MNAIFDNLSFLCYNCRQIKLRQLSKSNINLRGRVRPM
jgi:hypothetical protein